MPEVDKWRTWVFAQYQLFVFSCWEFFIFWSFSVNLSASFPGSLAPTSLLSNQALPPPTPVILNPPVLIVSVFFSPSSWFSPLFSRRLYCLGVAQTKRERRSIRRLPQRCSFDEPYPTMQAAARGFPPFCPSCAQGHSSVMRNSILVLLTREYESLTQMIWGFQPFESLKKPLECCWNPCVCTQAPPTHNPSWSTMRIPLILNWKTGRITSNHPTNYCDCCELQSYLFLHHSASWTN